VDGVIRGAMLVAAVGTAIALAVATVTAVGARVSRLRPAEMSSMTEGIGAWQTALLLAVVALPFLAGLAAVTRPWALSPAVIALGWAAWAGWRDLRAAEAERARPDLPYVVVIPGSWPVAVWATATAAALLAVVVALWAVETRRGQRRAPSPPVVTATARGR
jgi:hypothetical protein